MMTTNNFFTHPEVPVVSYGWEFVLEVVAVYYFAPMVVSHQFLPYFVMVEVKETSLLHKYINVLDYLQPTSNVHFVNYIPQ